MVRSFESFNVLGLLFSFLNVQQFRLSILKLSNLRFKINLNLNFT